MSEISLRETRDPSETPRPAVLIVDDDTRVAAAVARAVRDLGPGAICSDGRQALEEIRRGGIDVVVSDVRMPGMSGIELIRAIRELDLDLPVVLVTGMPDVDDAAEAVRHGAFRYLMKPLDGAALRAAVEEALRTRALARAERASAMPSREAVERDLQEALASLFVVYQPIVSATTRALAGYEALMRTRSKALPSPPAILEAAEKIGALRMVGRRVRELVSAQLRSGAERGFDVFVNLHPADLADPDLYDVTGGLAVHARRVVLELTERASLEGLPDLDARLAALRGIGYRIAVDDLGAGYAGLSYFAQVRPEVVKIDMSLVRSIDADAVKQRVVASLAQLTAGLGMEVVAEGVETSAERDTAIRLGCTMVQGYALARPGPAFPTFEWR